MQSGERQLKVCTLRQARSTSDGPLFQHWSGRRYDGLKIKSNLMWP